MSFVGRLKKRSGLFEVRKEGVRLYGCRLPDLNFGDGDKSIYVLLASEQKAGRSAADDDVLDTCEERLETLEDQVKTLKRESVVPGTTKGGRKR
jgi:hypothetical protein